ncbi:acetyl-CoA acetyltransferase [Photobacterium sp. SKA34]|nr:acetyl-CoA acetyltransferase [Photobacterium sp. SKA34]
MFLVPSLQQYAGRGTTNMRNGRDPDAKP